jgi:DNA-binding transcriptional LysR family regulator
MFNLKQIQVFLCAAETLSFAEAARRLQFSQPTVGYQIKLLEKEWGVDLFERSEHGLTLTEAGHLLLPRARELMHQSVRLQQIMNSFQQEGFSDLRIACSTTSGKYLLPLLAARFRERHPDIRISILACIPETAVAQVLNREADLGVVSHEVCGGELICQDFFHDKIVLIAPVGHPWTFRQSITVEDLLDEPLIIREPTSGTRRIMLSHLAKHDITLDDLNIFLEVGNAEAIVKTVEAGYGVAFVSRLSASCLLNNGCVVEVPVEDLDLQRRINMIRQHTGVPNRAQEVFWDFVHDPTNNDLYTLVSTTHGGCAQQILCSNHAQADVTAS